MKIPSLLSLALIIPSSAFAHLVNYDSKPYLELAKGNQEKADYIAHFCSLAADSVNDCMSRLLIAKGEVAAEKCGREISEILVEIQMLTHIVGESSRPGSGYYHSEMLWSKADGFHKYAYTPDTREVAARTMAAQFVIFAEKAAEKDQLSEKNTKESSSFIEGFGKLVAGMLGTSVETSLNGGGAHKDSSEKSTVSGLLTKEENAKAHNEGFSLGWRNPERAGLHPDLICMKGSPNCISPDGNVYKNDDNIVKVPPLPKDSLKDEGPASASKPKDEPKIPSSNEATPTDAKKGASNSASTNNSSWGLIQPGQAGELSPLQACYEREMGKIKKKEAVRNVERDEVLYVQQKESADANLQLGFCDENFYGRDFCNQWRFEQSLHIEATVNAPAEIEQPFEEFSSWEESHLSAIPGSNACNPFCPIESQPQ